MNVPKRNDPCPCGSGLKYKKCCMGKKAPSYHETDDIASPLATAFRLISQEQWEQAVDALKPLLATAQNPHVILEALAACYDGMEDYLLAAEYYEKALADCPEPRRPELFYRLGVSRACAQRIEKARDAFEASQDLQPGRAHKDQLQRVLDQLDRIIEGNDKPWFFLAQVQLQRAFSEMESERYEAAAARLLKLAEIDSENSAIFYNLGVVYTFLKQENDALGHFRRCVELDPEFVQAWYNMGQIHLIKERDLPLALSCFDRAATIKPDYVGAHHQRGVVHEALGNPEMAIRCWEKTLQIDPDNKQAKENIERLRAHPGQTPAREHDRKEAR